MPLVYHTLDVFTSSRFSGNPLAVVLGGDQLGDGQMQSIAREFNLSETVFVLKPENPAHSARIRIFTPQRELPFAGHPTIGTAALLAWQKYGDDGEHEAIISLEESIGLVRAGVVIKPGEALYSEFDVPQLAREAGTAKRRDSLAAALGLTGNEIGFEHHQPTVFSCGVPFVFVPVRDRTALSRARAVTPLWREGGFAGVGAAYLYCRECSDPDHAFSARLFSPEHGIPEDPATGSAAAALAGVVARFDGLADGHHVLMIEQGHDMGRPSLITLELEISAGRLEHTRIGGNSVLVMQGEITI